MFFLTPAELHAALNDLPVALLLASVLFDWAGSASKKDSLKSAAYWCLVLGVAGAILAVLSGLFAEGWVEHGGDTHLFIEQHETFAITATVFFAALAGWRIFRRDRLAGTERSIYLGISTLGVALLMWVAHLGGSLVFQQGLGVPSEVMREALSERDGAHEHDPGEEHDEAMDEELQNPADENRDDTAPDVSETSATPEAPEDHEHEDGVADH